ncbi:hypothetical protein CL633_00620 [bacterium]|nr:hypothetical protein [bacterium]|tara:strand:- start:34676 stop:35260 length:585 start_codon:yes stop_codon:yes gene_type:complete
MPKTLENLFNSKIRAKALKLIFRNPHTIFKAKEVSQRVKADYYAVRRELYKLEQIKLLSSQTIPSSNKKGFILNNKFDFMSELKNLVLKSAPISKDELGDKFKKLGKINLLLLSGIFLNQNKSRVDLLLVGDGIMQKKLNVLIHDLESEVGRELVYAYMNTEDFKYRKSMFDKFILEILEGPKEIVINKLGLGI